MSFHEHKKLITHKRALETKQTRHGSGICCSVKVHPIDEEADTELNNFQRYFLGPRQPPADSIMDHLESIADIIYNIYNREIENLQRQVEEDYDNVYIYGPAMLRVEAKYLSKIARLKEIIDEHKLLYPNVWPEVYRHVQNEDARIHARQMAIAEEIRILNAPLGDPDLP